MHRRRRYPSDLTNAQWAHLAPLLPAAKPGGHPRTVDLREVVNAILYLLREGCRWRALPHDFPPWSMAYGYCWHWRRAGTWQRVHDTLRERVRLAAGREPTPSAGCLDSQSVKTTQRGGRAATTRANTSWRGSWAEMRRGSRWMSTRSLWRAVTG